MLYREFSAGIYQTFAYDGFLDFNDWKDKADIATQALLLWHAEHQHRGKGDSVPVESKIYGALKSCLKEYFFGKCAYCESEFDAVAWGDVEHYRPKRGVAEDTTHPGYYWLAYSEKNLMPSCQLCNQGKGKRNRFPVEGRRASSPNDNLQEERPLLLNPYEQRDCGDSAQHIRYVFETFGWDVLPTGRVEGTTERGHVSIEVYDLNRPKLVMRRRRSQVAAIKALRLAATGTSELLALEWAKCLDSSQEHASAVRAACVEWRTHYLRQLQQATCDTQFRCPQPRGI